MDTIRLYDAGTTEAARLRSAAEEMTARSRKGTAFRVGDCYFDYGARWMWTTIIARRPDGTEWQALCPRDHEKIITSDNIPETVREIMTDKYWYE